MPATLNQSGYLKIEEYEFGAFLMEVQKAFEQGFVLDLETNDHYPQKFGNMMEVTLVSTNFKPVTENNFSVSEEDTTPEVIPEVTPQVETEVPTQRKGRKASTN